MIENPFVVVDSEGTMRTLNLLQIVSANFDGPDLNATIRMSNGDVLNLTDKRSNSSS